MDSKSTRASPTAAANRLRAASVAAQEAEAGGDPWAAAEAWRRYRLISDAQRDPDELIAEGLKLSRFAISVADQA